MVRVYVAGDTGPSGFGVATRYLVKHLLDVDDIELTFRTHFWGMNDEGIYFENSRFPDQRFQERLLTDEVVNDDYLIEDPRESADREDDLMANLGSNESIEPQKPLIRQFDGKEDVWLAVGGIEFAEQAPEDDDIYTIVSTDYNVDTVPRSWEWYIKQVDEIWVPSQWTKQSILNRFPEADVHAFPYGVPMDYEPTEYDCNSCPHLQKQVSPDQAQCLRDGSFNFAVVSRFYHIKGLYRTIKAYIEEFREGENVRLFIKTTANKQFNFNPVQAAQSVINETGYPDVPEIGFATESFETQYLYDLLGHVDAFLQPSRAECFGIAQFQAAYAGTPVVATNWSAQAELIPDDHEGFHLIDDYDVERPRHESNAFKFGINDDYPPDSHWATPSVEAIQEKMRMLYEMSESELAREGESARQYVVETFDWKDRIQPRVERLREVAI